MVFRWRADQSEVNPQSEILLQLAVDGLAEALGRSRSVLGPRPPAVTEDAPAAAVKSTVSSAGASA
jgi:hypothetical protein